MAEDAPKGGWLSHSHSRVAYALAALAATITVGSGIVNVWTVMSPALPERFAVVRDLFPFEFLRLSRSIVLLAGFTLIVSGVNIYKRKRRAWLLVTVMAAASAVLHLTYGLNYEEAAVSGLLLVTLFALRRRFTVRSSAPSLRWVVVRLSVGMVVAVTYGVAGFWFLEEQEFHVSFHIDDAIAETLRFLLFVGDPSLTPRTHFAQWFMDSLYFMSTITIVYALWSLFGPVYYKFRMYPRERLAAKAIVQAHGRSSLDYFKYWPDKSYLFGSERTAMVAYRVARGFALALADPVGPEEQIEPTVREFCALCDENGWKPGFHQTLPDFLPVYQRLGFRKIKIGDDAVCDLTAFSLDGRERKEFRHTLNSLEKRGVRFERIEPPITDALLLELADVSDAWLRIDGKRERQFTLGVFDVDYVRTTPVCLARDEGGRVLGFLNEIPSHCKGEGTIDLMRRRADVPDGLMDFLFVKTIIRFRDAGYTRFNLGMAPLAGFAEGEEAGLDERFIHDFFKHMNFLFNYQGLRHFKAKYASVWEPRYSVFRSLVDLPQFMLALRDISEVKGK